MPKRNSKAYEYPWIGITKTEPIVRMTNVKMSKLEFLQSNPRKLIKLLRGVISDNEIQKIEEEIDKHAKQLVNLSDCHLRFANQLSGRGVWRQRVSRAYYACYNLSKAVRLTSSGFYSTEASDHKKIGKLPSDFPESDVWSDFLTKFRADRNVADYDHAANERSLEYSSHEYLIKAVTFSRATKRYMKENRT